jgi:hypothetical protein
VVLRGIGGNLLMVSSSLATHLLEGLQQYSVPSARGSRYVQLVPFKFFLCLGSMADFLLDDWRFNWDLFDSILWPGLFQVASERNLCHEHG